MTERQIAKEASNRLQTDILSKIERDYKTRTGTAKRETDVRARFSNKQLKRIIVNAPKYMFIQNYGFEGIKSNSVKMRLEAKKTIDKAIDDTGVIDYLADNLAETRADEVVVVFNRI